MTAEGEKLLPCPFCGCEMRVASNRDWHRLIGEHGDCVFDCQDDTTGLWPATDEALAEMIAAWNRRTLPAPNADAERVARELLAEELEADARYSTAAQILAGKTPSIVTGLALRAITRALAALPVADEAAVERVDCYEFSVFVDGDPVAGGTGSARDCLREADHYAMAYEAEGDVSVEFHERRKTTRAALSAMEKP